MAETYIRIFQRIPEADRPFVRRALIWLGGHAGAPWHTNCGIKGDVLASAASHDLQLDGMESPSSFYDIEYFGELCGCLITVSTNVSEADIMLNWTGEATSQDLPPVTCSLSLVTLAHYTVLEFLSSPFIHETDVSYFALTKSTIATEFTKSILLQAASADPQGDGTSWLHDREAYCLTLAPALIMNNGCKEITNLVARYLDPRSPHYSRIFEVQRFLAEIQGGWSFYYIYNIPEYHLQDHPSPDIAGEAAILLNMVLSGYVDPMVPDNLQAFLAQSHNLGELLTTHLTIAYHTLNIKSSVTRTVLEILLHVRYDKICWLVDYYSQCFDPTTILGEIINSRLRHKLDGGSSLIHILIKHGADPNGPGCYLTPLKASVYYGYSQCVRLLLDAGANPTFTGDFPRAFEREDLPEWITHSNATPLAFLRRLQREGLARDQLPEIGHLLLEYKAVP